MNMARHLAYCHLIPFVQVHCRDYISWWLTFGPIAYTCVRILGNLGTKYTRCEFQIDQRNSEHLVDGTKKEETEKKKNFMTPSLQLT